MPAHRHQTPQAHLVIMAKYPTAGRVKTRLGNDIGTFRACQIYRILLKKNLRTFHQDKRFKITIATAPDIKCRDGFWHKRLGTTRPPKRVGQGIGNLGQRMWRRMQDNSEAPLLMIGADCPYISKIIIKQALRQVKRCDFILGPANDGGYWLIGRRAGLNLSGGLKKTPLHGITWSSETTLSMTLEKLNHAGFKTSTNLPTLCDIDQGKDYYNWLNVKKISA